jgi:NDP-sugar pyrophosphorylase family protein/aminoglycoside/choline kinase family phosphotransferase
MSLSIFILAAGFGERLHPVTDPFPKPLLPILGKPILQSILEKVSTLPVHKIGINLHHKKELIENWLRQSAFSKKVKIFPEESVFGTGGALKNAEAFLNTGTFLVHNSDIISDIDLGKLLEFHLSSDNLVTLAVHDYPQFNNLVVDEQQLIRNICKVNCVPLETLKLLAFTGIAVYSSEFLRFLPSGFSSITDTWLKVIKSGYKVGTFDVTGCIWSDIGTPASYVSTIINELRQNGEYVYIHPSIGICRHIELDGYVVAEEGTSLDKGVSIRNCILLPGSETESGFNYENCILGPGFKINLNESEMLGFLKGVNSLLIGTGGSDRKYYRTKIDGNSAVLMQCSPDDPDFQRHIEYTQFFLRYSIPVPELLQVETEKMSAMFEDLGDLSLYSYLKCPREQKDVEEVYKRVIDILIMMHTIVTEHVAECPLLMNRIFDYEYLRWETSYFIERFVEGIMNIRVKNPSVLDHEFHRLATTVDSYLKTVIHRDFQSQNIMITKGGIPRLLDYQSSRIAPPAYDVVSLLWDPYYRLEDDMRERLLDYYIDKMKMSNTPSPPLLKGDKGVFFNTTNFKETILSCRLQRHMQALGAYGFLSQVKGKKYFLKHVPEGLRLLKEDVSLSKDKYRHLYDLVMSL